MRITIEISGPDADRATLLALARAIARAAKGVPLDPRWGCHKGIVKFARAIGVSQQSVRRALDGEAGGGRIRREWAKWQKMQGGSRARQEVRS